MNVERTGDKDIRFIGPSLEKEGELCTYGIRVGRKDTADDLVRAITDNKNIGLHSETSSSTTSTTTNNNNSNNKSDPPESTESTPTKV